MHHELVNRPVAVKQTLCAHLLHIFSGKSLLQWQQQWHLFFTQALSESTAPFLEVFGQQAQVANETLTRCT